MKSPSCSPARKSKMTIAATDETCEIATIMAIVSIKITTEKISVSRVLFVT